VGGGRGAAAASSSLQERCRLDSVGLDKGMGVAAPASAAAAGRRHLDAAGFVFRLLSHSHGDESINQLIKFLTKS
jgi:hypothetical protein